jgi:hypothetical protein
MIDRRLRVLLFGCAACAAVIVTEVYAGRDDHAVQDILASDNSGPMIPAILQPQPERLMATVLSRPLFSPTRRPPSQDGEHDFDLSDKRLTGIVIAREHRIAIFAVAGAKPLLLTEGETVNGWQIESITAHEIALRGPAGTRTLQPRAEESVAQRMPGAASILRPPASATAPPPGPINLPFAPDGLPAARRRR